MLVEQNKLKISQGLMKIQKMHCLKNMLMKLNALKLYLRESHSRQLLQIIKILLIQSIIFIKMEILMMKILINN